MKTIGLGCLIALVIFLFIGLSCTRACFRGRRYYRRYGEVIYPVVPGVVNQRVHYSHDTCGLPFA